MKHKTVSSQAGLFLAHMQDKNRNWFSLNYAYAAYPDMSNGSIRSMIKRMCDAGLLLKLKPELYWVIPFEMDSESYFPDWHLLAEPLSAGKHYIGYYSALQIHGLITQPSLKEQIVIAKQVKRSSTLDIKGVEFQFVYHNAKHFFGYKKIWIDSFNKVLCSDLEKTIVDCLYKPNYAGGIVEIAKAIHIAREKIDFHKLLQYVKQFDAQVVVKRLGYLLELMEIDAPIIADLHAMRTASISALDTEIPNVGKVMSRWSIRQNVDQETIKNSIYS